MMLNAWHLPVPPFVKQSKDQLLITLWLTGEDPPQRIMLRTEHDNEEMSVSMHKQRSQQQPGVTAWRAIGVKSFLIHYRVRENIWCWGQSQQRIS